MIGNWEINGLDEADLHYVLAEANADAACRLSQDMLNGTYQSTWSHAKVLMSLVHHSVELFIKYALARAGQQVPRHHYIRELHQLYVSAYNGQEFAFEPPFIVQFMEHSVDQTRQAILAEKNDRNQTDQMLRYHADRNGSPWKNIIKKVWEADPLLCPKCQKEMRIVALIDEREVIERILRHLGLWQQGVRVIPGPDPPGDWVIEPCLDETLPDYDTDPDLIYANA